MDSITLTSLIPAEISLGSMIKFIAFLVCILMIAGLIFRLLLGRNSALNKALCAGIGVLCIYVMTVIVYTFSPGNLEEYLAPLPFVKFSGAYIYLMPLSDVAFSSICAEILSMVILVLLYNLADSLLPDGESLITWFVLRFLTIVAAMGAHYFVTSVTQSFLPELLVAYGPTILLVCLIASLLVGVVGAILGLLLTVLNPIFGILFTFFFSNKFGKQLSKAMLTTSVLTALVLFLNRFGYSVISISPAALLSYIPLLAVLLGCWCLIGRKF